MNFDNLRGAKRIRLSFTKLNKIFSIEGNVTQTSLFSFVISNTALGSYSITPENIDSWQFLEILELKNL